MIRLAIKFSKKSSAQWEWVASHLRVDLMANSKDFGPVFTPVPVSKYSECMNA